MSTKYIINNEDGLITTGQTINGGLSATTISADTLIISGSPVPQPSYKVYAAFLGQTGTTAPYPITVLQDDLGDVTFTYFSLGNYRVNSPSFTLNRTIVNGINPKLTSSYPISVSTSNNSTIKMGGGPVSSLEVRIPGSFEQGTNMYFFISTLFNGSYADDVLDKYNTFLEIRVYN